jgi:hypothetical protein
MKMLFGTGILLAFILAEPCAAQVRATKAGSAEAQQKIADYRDQIAAGTPKAGDLSVAGLRVGAEGTPRFIDAKVMQVIDDKQMLVGVEDARTGNGRYGTWIMVKCSTAGIADGKFWRGAQWKEVTGSDDLKVTGTTTYTTQSGGTKTVFVVVPANASTPPAPPPARAGVTAPARVANHPRLDAAAYQKVRDEVIAAGAVAKYYMGKEGLSEADKKFVNEYVNAHQGRLPSVNGLSEQLQKVLQSEEVKNWVKAEIQYQTALKK